MVGWLDTALELVENGQQVNLPFGYAKGTPPPGFLRLAVSHTPGTAERELNFVLVMASLYRMLALGIIVHQGIWTIYNIFSLPQ